MPRQQHCIPNKGGSPPPPHPRRFPGLCPYTHPRSRHKGLFEALVNLCFNEISSFVQGCQHYLRQRQEIEAVLENADSTAVVPGTKGSDEAGVPNVMGQSKWGGGGGNDGGMPSGSVASVGGMSVASTGGRRRRKEVDARFTEVGLATRDPRRNRKYGADELGNTSFPPLRPHKICSVLITSAIHPTSLWLLEKVMSATARLRYCYWRQQTGTTIKTCRKRPLNATMASQPARQDSVLAKKA